jgi:GTPase Era involved in 16S rRNA processing
VSNQREFENVIFVDTPGLADGQLKYKFEIEKSIEWMASHCDLILTFFDPHG